MSPLNVLSTRQAAEEKGCSMQAILDAINRGAIDGQKVGREHIVRPNRKYQEWQPARWRQEIGRQGQKQGKSPQDQ